MTKTTKLSKISNLIFIFTSAFALFFLWCNFYVKNLKISIISSIFFIIAFAIIYYILNSFINKQKLSKKNNYDAIENFKTELKFSNNTKIIALLKKVYNFEILSTMENHIITKDSDIFFDYTQNLDDSSIIKYINSSATNNIKIHCIDNNICILSPENIEIHLISIKDLFHLLQEKKIDIPKEIKLKKKAKIKLKDIFCVVLCKERSKSYFWFGILLLFSSLFTPFSSYYIIMSTILLLLSIFSRFNPYFN